MVSYNVGRNDPCPCGSGLKYKKCCMLKEKPDEPKVDDKMLDLYRRRYKIRFKTPKEIEGIRKCGRLVVDTLYLVRDFIKPGITTNDINKLVHDFTVKNGATPAPLNYHGFPKSVCTSINDCVCHGIPSDRKLIEGDIINIDITSILNGYFADANMTFPVGEIGPDAQKIIKVSRESLKRALKIVKPFVTLGDIGATIQEYAEGEEHCSVVRDYVGHGVGIGFHEQPDVPHYGRRGTGMPVLPNMIFTIEPMINLGKRYCKVLSDGWTALTLDGSLSAQFEQTILITDNGYESLTPFNLD